MRNAGWTPEYLIQCDEVHQPLRFTLYANIKQNTGVDWRHVPIEVTTATPNRLLALPTIEPIYVSLMKSPKVRALREASKENAADIGGDEFGFGDDSGGFDDFGGDFGDFEASPTMEQPHQHVSLTTTETYQTYATRLRYTILSNNKPYKVALSETKVDADYTYFTIPKKNPSAFLVATIKNLAVLALIPAQAKILYKNQYAGTVSIDPKTTEIFQIPLGIDKDIAVKYEIAKQYTKIKMVGTHIREQRGYKITIRNNKAVDVKILVKDQIPLSRTSLVEVEPEELSKGNYDPETGFIEWEITVASNKSETLLFSFVIKYPKGSNIVIK